MPQGSETLTPEPEMTQKEFFHEVVRISEGMKQGEHGALCEMRDLLVGKYQDGMPVNLEELRCRVGGSEFVLSLFVAQKILVDLDRKFGSDLSVESLSGGEQALKYLNRSLGQALYDRFCLGRYHTINLLLGEAIVHYGELTGFTKKEA